MGGAHIPVLLRECIEGLNIRPDGTYIDGTLGRGGHAEKIAEKLVTGRLVGMDCDETAIREAGERLSPFAGHVTLVKANFRDISGVLDGLGIKKVDGMLFDLGVSSPQLDDEERGFSYKADAPLDMRMDRSSELTAYEIVNRWPVKEIRRILYEYGEERNADRIAAAIDRRRRVEPVKTTLELAEIVRKAQPPAALREKQHPAKRTFQAIRIAVNDELSALSEMLPEAMDRLSSGGRLCVISFHSLEDRIVKGAIRSKENGCTCPPGFPVCVCGFTKTMRSVTKKPVVPSEEEIIQNPRSRSAKLRIAEHI